MNKLKSWRSVSLVLWIFITFFVIKTMPNLEQLVREKGQLEIPKTAQSEVANTMIENMDENSGKQYQIIAVFNSGSDKSLSSLQTADVNSVIKELKSKQNELGIKEIVSHLDNEETKKQLLSGDGSTILTQISVDKNQGTITEVAEELNKIVKIDNVKTYLTGNELVSEDFVKSTEEGVKKTEIIAVVFIVGVLILVFRSPIVPIISLLTVGISYIVSMGIITHLVDQFNYPFSTFTQVFLVVILFGIGTDYNILLYTRFKEELVHQENVFLAVKSTYRSAGKTVLYSGLAVFIGFMALLLAQFKLYQSTSAVAIGVGVLLLVLITLNPFFMVLLGKKMFWPVKRFEGHSDSRIWHFLSRNSVASPILSILLVAVLSVPFIVQYTRILNYNDLLEVDDAYLSKQGITVIEKHFSPGFSSPATLVIQTDKKLDNQKSLQALDELAAKVANVKGVFEVYSATRPAGEPLNKLYINDQTTELNTGLGKSKNGISEINKGLSSAENEMSNNDSNGLSNVQRLIDGTSEAKNGVATLQNAMEDLNKGIKNGSQGAHQLEQGLGSLNENIQSLSIATSGLYSGYLELEKGLNSFTMYFTSISQAVEGAKQGYAQIEDSMNNLIKSNPSLGNDQNVQKTLAIAKSGQQQLGELTNNLAMLTPQYQSAMTSFSEANAALLEINRAFTHIENGVSELQVGAESLKNGLNEGVSGSGLLASKTTDVESGLSQINDGQKQLLTGLDDLQDKMTQLQTGLGKSTKGLSKVQTGLNEAQTYLSDISKSDASKKFYIPQEVLEGNDFQQSLNMYMSKDRETAKMTIILDVNPYSKEAMPIMKNMNKQVEAALKGTELSDAKVALGGKTSQNEDLKEISSNDFFRTATIMLIGIGLVLIFITRSILQPVYIIGSLVLAYFSSLGISEILSKYILNIDSLSWNVPFFGFIMIVALGVDYSIFLMMRLKEIDADSTTAIVEAARHIGGVVISAAIILGGTFAALIPSGILTLIQVATVVMVGLLMLSVLMLPILVPSLIGLTHKISLFHKKENDHFQSNKAKEA